MANFGNFGADFGRFRGHKLGEKGFGGFKGGQKCAPPNSQLLKWGNSTKKEVKTTQNARFLQNLANFGPILVDFWAVKACDKGQRGSREVRKVFPPIPDP